MFNLKNASVETVKYEKTGISGGQGFQFKVRQKSEEGEANHEFTMSSSLFDELGFKSDKSAAFVPSKNKKTGKVDAVAIVVTPEGDEAATIYVKRIKKETDEEGNEVIVDSNKNPKFKHSFLLRGLIEAGQMEGEVVDGKAVVTPGSHHFFKLEKFCEVKSIDDTSDDYLQEAPEGEGLPLYVIVADAELNAKAREKEEEKEEEVVSAEEA